MKIRRRQNDCQNARGLFYSRERGLLYSREVACNVLLCIETVYAMCWFDEDILGIPVVQNSSGEQSAMH